MRLSLWQQFSSNHSARFTVVGEFASKEAAEDAASKMRQFFKEINDWFESPENVEAKEDREDGEYAPVSEPELQISNQLGIIWYESTLDWYPSDGNVMTLDHIVLVQPSQTWQGGKPLAELLAKYGAKGMVDGDVGDFDSGEAIRHINIRFTCLAPTETIAQSIIQSIDDYLVKYRLSMENWGNPNHQSTMFETPWKLFSTDLWSSFNTFSGKVSQDGSELTFDQVSFFRTGQGLPAMVAWLRSLGCSDFDYQLTEEIETEDD